MDKYLVYIHKNKINDKVYVGQTCCSAQERWRGGSGYKQQFFYEAIEEFGWDNFEHIIVAENLTMAEAQELEKELIAKYNSNDPEFGYNKTKGGFGSTGREWTQEDREKMSKIQLECWDDEQRHTQAKQTQSEIWNSPEGRAQRSQQAKEIWKRDDYRATHTGANHARSKPVMCIQTGQIFENARRAAEWAKQANPQNIGKCCKHERARAGVHPETGEKLGWRFVEKD